MFLFLITIIGSFLRFYSLLWGDGFFFHPDERNMAMAVSQLCLSFPRTSNLEPRTCSMHPHFFAYGQFPLYLAYFSYQIIQFLLSLWKSPSITSLLDFAPAKVAPHVGRHYSLSPVPLGQGVFWLRFWSALASTLTIPVVYLITKEFLRARGGNKIFADKGRGEPTKFSLFAISERLRATFKTPEVSSRAVSEQENFRRRPQRPFLTDFSATPLFAALLTTFTPGLIQAAHLGTTESLLTFFLMVIIYLSLLVLKTEKLKYLFLLGITTGVALGTKLSAAFFIFAPMIAMALVSKKRVGSIFKKIITFFLFAIFYSLFAILFFFLSSPYNFLDFNEFLRISTYEAQIAQGKIQIFYTHQFEKTIPIFYQLNRIFPFALGPALELLGILGLLLLIGQNVRYHPRSRYQIDIHSLILIVSLLAYFLPNAFLFCKWTRFMTPILPFFAILSSLLFLQIFNFLEGLSQKTQNSKLDFRRKLAAQPRQTQNYSLKLKTFNFLIVIFSFSLLVLSLFPGLLFFSIYTKPDVRVEASEWIYRNISKGSYILSETANMVDIPITPRDFNFEPRSYKVISFNFYDLDIDPSLFEDLINHLEAADYIFIPSSRVFAHRLRLSEKYPLTASYYSLLFSGNLGFEKIAQFSRLPDEKAEETWSVFDHPVIRIYKKVRPFSKEEYRTLFKVSFKIYDTIVE